MRRTYANCRYRLALRILTDARRHSKRKFLMIYNFSVTLHRTLMVLMIFNFSAFLHDIETLAAQYDECVNSKKADEKYRLLRKAQSTLISAQELGDEKLQIIQQLQDLIENKTRSLDNDYRNIGKLLSFAERLCSLIIIPR